MIRLEIYVIDVAENQTTLHIRLIVFGTAVVQKEIVLKVSENYIYQTNIDSTSHNETS